MPVKIRLRRMGAKKRPFYRVVVADSRSPRDGRFIETIGTYNPLTNPPTTTLKADKAKYWLSVGAQPTEAAERILRWNHVLPPREEEGLPTAPAEALVAESVVPTQPVSETPPEAPVEAPTPTEG